MGCNCGNKSKSRVSSVPVDTGVHKSSCGGEHHKCSCGKEHHECKCGGEHNHECKCGSHACVQDHSTTLVESVYTTTVEVTHDFTMPAVDECVQLHLKDVTNLLPGAILWNQSVGYLHVKSYDSTTGYATACNQGEENNAEAGSTFPSCMSFTVGIPTHCECNNTNGVCLAADMTSPGEGDQTEVSVTTVSGLFQGDIIDIAGYLYRITAITNVNSIIVKNEGFGAPIGTVIKNDPNCTGKPCTVPITVVNSDDPCTQNEVHSGVMIVCDEGVKRPFTGTANTQVPVWDDTNKVWVPKTVRLADACTNLTKELLLDPLVVTYIVYVETTNLFQINDHVEIDGTQYTVTTILGPTQMRITTDTAPAGVQVIDAGTAICRLDDSGECNACERITTLETKPYSGVLAVPKSINSLAVTTPNTELKNTTRSLTALNETQPTTTFTNTITIAPVTTENKYVSLVGTVVLQYKGTGYGDSHYQDHTDGKNAFVYTVPVRACLSGNVTLTNNGNTNTLFQSFVVNFYSNGVRGDADKRGVRYGNSAFTINGLYTYDAFYSTPINYDGYYKYNTAAPRQRTNGSATPMTQTVVLPISVTVKGNVSTTFAISAQIMMLNARGGIGRDEQDPADAHFTDETVYMQVRETMIATSLAWVLQ